MCTQAVPRSKPIYNSVGEVSFAAWQGASVFGGGEQGKAGLGAEKDENNNMEKESLGVAATVVQQQKTLTWRERLQAQRAQQA